MASKAVRRCFYRSSYCVFELEDESQLNYAPNPSPQERLMSIF